MYVRILIAFRKKARGEYMKKYRLFLAILLSVILISLTSIAYQLYIDKQQQIEQKLARLEKPQLLLRKTGEFNIIPTEDFTLFLETKEAEQVKDIEEKSVVAELLDNKEDYPSPDPIVYDNLTMQALADKLERSMNSTISGSGYHFASKALELGVDPYLALAIVLEETGCTWNCSSLVNNCHNIGGQKGTGCGAYQYFDSLEAGIDGFLNNLYKNYYAYGLTTPETINPKYAENPRWSYNVSNYITKIKNN